MEKPIAILGAGSWGTALALHLAHLDQPVRLWTFEKDHVVSMQQEKKNLRYMRDHSFPPSLLPIADLDEAIHDAEDILIAVPSVAFHKLLLALSSRLKSNVGILCATKGLDEESGLLLHEVASNTLRDNHPYGILSGPSYAKEVAQGLPTAVVIASKDRSFSEKMSKRFNHNLFRVYLSTDVIGVEVGGAVKNVIAIAAGMSDGMGFGTNARCALITRGLAEITRLGMALGGQFETFTGLTGLGDLVLTCTDNQSRNRRFGLYLGEGLNPTDAVNKVGQVVEGQRNAELVMKLANKMNVEMPIVNSVFNILQGSMTCHDALHALLSRATRSEQ